ncbi:MAG: helix-turn-helix domain-containing protein [Xenococcaceae cyanobacterium]
MLKKNSIFVDYQKQGNNALSSILPHSSLISSYQQRWHGIHFEYHCQPKHDTPEHYWEQHVIAISNDRNSTPLDNKRILNDRYKQEKIHNGDIVIIPAKTNHQSCWNRETEFMLLILDPIAIATSAWDLCDPDRIEILPHFAQSDPLVTQIGLTLKAELESNSAIDYCYLNSAANLLAIHLLRFYANKKPIVKEYSDGLSRSNLQQISEYVRANLDRDLRLEKLAALLQMSTFYFARLFKQSTNLTPHQYIIRCRLEKAKNLLLLGDTSIVDICQKVGFQSQSHFTQLFRKYTGTTPKKYQER